LEIVVACDPRSFLIGKLEAGTFAIPGAENNGILIGSGMVVADATLSSPRQIMVGADMETIQLGLDEASDFSAKFAALDGLKFFECILAIQKVEKTLADGLCAGRHDVVLWVNSSGRCQSPHPFASAQHPISCWSAASPL
jgi:hypothetical protein